MGEYKRWVSYIYSYERGIKSINTGYVRIESRNGKCRMTVNIKGGNAQGNGLTMYLFYRRGADMIMVYAGEGEFYNGVCEFVAQTMCDDVFGSGKDINEMGGVIAYSTLDKFYGTEWDDKPIVLRRIIEHENYVADNHNQSVISFNGSSYDDSSHDNTSTYNESINNESVNNENINNENIIENPDDEMVLEQSIDKFDVKKDSENLKENDNQQNYDAVVEEMLNSVDNFSENGEIVEKLGEHLNEKLDENSSLGRIFAKMPGMYPFEDDDIIECVKFEPQDIGVFPMDKWVLASNSFLLHGYYTYRHLIFARRRTSEGAKCMLGVPGMFRDREKFMAGMFGFGKFKSVRGKKNPGYGEFGYWYMDIDMDENNGEGA